MKEQSLIFSPTENTQTKVKAINDQDLTKLIEVTSPYFALTNITIETDGYITAEFQTEMTEHEEIPCISLSEVGRHIAILGSLAMAKENPVKEKHYYLACDAWFDRLHSQAIDTKNFKIRAKVLDINKKGGTIHGQLFASDGTLTYNSEVTYATINYKIFERKFRSKYISHIPENKKNPYTQRTLLIFENRTKETFSAYTDTIQPEDCLGHFDNYPAMPVARISGAMFEASGNHYNLLRNSREKYCIKRVEMHANSFIFAGEKAKIETMVVNNSPDNTIIEAHTLNNKDFNHVAVETKCWFY